jgi:hypothetical protein
MSSFISILLVNSSVFMHIPESHILNCLGLYILFVRFMLPHLATEVAYILLILEFTPSYCTRNKWIEEFLCSDMCTDDFTEICNLLYCFSLRDKKVRKL